MIDEQQRPWPERTTRRRVGPAVAGFAPCAALGAMLLLTVWAPPGALLWVLALGTAVVVASATSLARAQRRGLHAHASGLPHSHRAGWRPHTHPTRAERVWSRWDRWTAGSTSAATPADAAGGRPGPPPA